jgi:hypothetical protein
MTAYTSQSTEKLTALYSKLDNQYSKEYGKERPYVDFLVNGDMSWRTAKMISDGSEFEDRYFYVINLKKDSLKSDVRKSYKSLINKQDGVIFSPTVYNLKELHHKVAGRKTRSDKTWDIQQEMINAGEAFVVELYKDGTLLSAALFYINKWCCYYAVAASLECVNSHPVIWAAIEYCKEEGLNRFELGEKLEGTEKEKNISKFKSGFGAELEKRLIEKEKK